MTDTDQHTGQRTLAIAVRFIGYLIYIYVVIVEIILALGFFLLLFGANSTSGFVEWIYRSVDRAMRPFRGIFEPIELGTTGGDVPAVFDTSILFAMIIYGIVAIALKALLDWLTERVNRIDRENRLRSQQAAYQEAATAAQAYPAAAPEPAPDASRSVPSATPSSEGTTQGSTQPPPPPPTAQS